MARKSVFVEERQSLFDLAIQKYGSIEGAVQLMVENTDKVSDVTMLPTPTDILKCNATVVNQDVLDYYVKYNLKPVSLKNGQEPYPGDFNIDFNNDYYN